MSSMQKTHEERAQSAAQRAADELHAARRDQVRDEAPASPRAAASDGDGGILGSVQESARSVMGAVQDTFSRGGGGRGGTTRDSAAGDTMAAVGDYAEEGKAKARGVADAAMGKATETKDAAADRARSARDAAADKTKVAGGDSEEDVMLRVKDADQMTGQAFNDVGKMGEEGTGMPRRRSSG